MTFPPRLGGPPRLPIDVLPETNCTALMDPGLSPEERLKFFGARAAWSRGSAGIGYHAPASYSDGLNRNIYLWIYLWERMGFVVSRPASRSGPQDAARPKEIPAKLFVEMDRASMDLFMNTPPFPGIIPPPKR